MVATDLQRASVFDKLDSAKWGITETKTSIRPELYVAFMLVTCIVYALVYIGDALIGLREAIIRQEMT